MSLRINEIMQRFSSLASEMKDAETASQAETERSPRTRGPPLSIYTSRKVIIFQDLELIAGSV